MFDAIRREYPDDEWLTSLSCSRQCLVEQETKKSHESDSEVDALLYTQLCDKADIIRKKCALGVSGRKLRPQFRSINELRHKVAHANNYAMTLQDAEELSSTVQTLLELRSKIEGYNRSA